MTADAQAAAERGVDFSPTAESAHYALLRRLAPSMRHHLVVNLQPIGMIYEVLDRRLRAPQPNLAEVQESAQKINGFARAALASCLDVVTWLSPEQDKTTSVAEGVRECLGLLATSLTFRGFALRNEVAGIDGEVHRGSTRTLLTAALIHLTDHSLPPADLVLAAKREGEHVKLTITVRPTEGEQGFAGETAYRRLQWEDIEALAAAEGLSVERSGRQQVQLTIPLAAKA